MQDISKLDKASCAFYQECADLVGMTVEEFLQAGI